MKTVKDLLKEYLESESRLIFEFSGDFYNDCLKLVSRGRQWCDDLGMEWNNDLIPESVQDAIQNYQDD